MENISRPKVAVFVTGGTIVCHYDEEKHVLTPSFSGKQLMASLPNLKVPYDLELIEFSNVPGPHLTPPIALRLARDVGRMLERDDVLGAVIVQGTDTLEEIAYLFHLLVNHEKPIVFTGAMKSIEELYTDAQGNMWGAIRLAACAEARNHGVMVYFNQEILSARYVIKSDANNMNSFRAVGTGPMGNINGDQITLFHRPQYTEHYDVDKLDSDIQLVKACCGMSSLLLDVCVEKGVDGIVIEGLGAGNVPPNIVPSIQRALDKHIPVVMVSRCTEGFALGTYSYEGGGAQLEEMGVIYGGDLNGQKARVKLMVLCSVSCDPQYIAANFGMQPSRSI